MCICTRNIRLVFDMEIQISLIFFISSLSKYTVALENVKPESFCNANIPITQNSVSEGKGSITHELSDTTRKSWIIHVNEEDSLGILLNFTNFLLEQHFLVIRDVKVAAHSEIQLISGKSNGKPLLFLIPFAKSFYMEICPEGNILDRGKFNLVYKRREPEPEDPIPTEETPAQKEKGSYEIQLSGKSKKNFLDVAFSREFKKVVKEIARRYCFSKNIYYQDDRTAEDMVIFVEVRDCPFEWTDRDSCVSLKHSVHVSCSEDNIHRTISEYQLTAEHLKEMWQKCDPENLRQLGLQIYELPVEGDTILCWSLISILPLVASIVIVMATRKFCNRIKDKQHEKLTSANSSVEKEKKEKRVKYKLKPNEHQVIPRFMTESKRINEVGIMNSSYFHNPDDIKEYAAGLYLSAYNAQRHNGNP